MMKDMDKTHAFRFDFGDHALNFVATVGSRCSSKPIERLPNTDALYRWIRLSGIVDSADEIQSFTQQDFQYALRLREALHGLLHDFLHQSSIDDADLLIINQCAQQSAMPTIQLEKDLNDQLCRVGHKISIQQILACIATAALLLVSSEQKQLLRECQGKTCDGIYIDRSRGFRRQWCSSEVCGNSKRVETHRSKIKSAHDG